MKLVYLPFVGNIKLYLGRGPLAGPVVAAACFVPMDVYIEGVQDSKTLSEEQRELLFKKLTSHPKVEYSVHVGLCLGEIVRCCR